MKAVSIIPPLVIKIGGSLAGSGGVSSVLDAIARSPRRVVVVPGGGAYADAVRADQARFGFSDSQAHRLAIFAMHRMASDFLERNPKLTSASSLDAISSAWDDGHTPVWLPWAMVEHEPSIPQDWSITSDGLAAWLATRIKGAEVALVKSCTVAPGATLEELAASGITDPNFPLIVSSAGLEWQVLSHSDDARLSALLQPNRLPA